MYSSKQARTKQTERLQTFAKLAPPAAAAAASLPAGGEKASSGGLIGALFNNKK